MTVSRRCPECGARRHRRGLVMPMNPGTLTLRRCANIWHFGGWKVRE
jgi:hypothetical protein